MQKYPRIIELYAYIQKIFGVIILFRMHFLICFGYVYLQSYQSRLHYYYITYKAFQ